MIKVYFSLGSNMGDRFHYLKKAVQALNQARETTLTKVSSIYETDPVGFVDQPPFLNLVVEGVTTLSPHELLREVLFIEEKLGRKRNIRWGPRTIDIDILLYGEQVINSEQLEIPHPRMKDRAFVLIPLEEIAKECLVPVESNRYIITELLAKLDDKSGVTKWMNYNWETELEPSES